MVPVISVTVVVPVLKSLDVEYCNVYDVAPATACHVKAGVRLVPVAPLAGEERIGGGDTCRLTSATAPMLKALTLDSAPDKNR